ncbi:aconitate hydratase AcnA [Roseiterribacter gracilis]|uniref:Aconitate hydratase A n=1 Tax=Roseiterribacter gracilis TaxID=2812848 RepID=A0A8S8X633_9PROT|nr:aconitate hydratase [Rhodospirillales bacterium TMPK1]
MERLFSLSDAAGSALTRLPYVLRILLENVLRNAGDDAERSRAAILGWLDRATSEDEIPFLPSRVLMHDTTCVPALADIAGMRSALAEAGGDPSRLNPVLPVDVSVDHSLAVDFFGSSDAAARNMAREFERNRERYVFMKWASQTMRGVHVHPPGTGIMHTINLERLASVVTTTNGVVNPDTLIGTDSHTPMINGIGVLAWGVGGLEAESVMFGMPVMLRVPDVIGVRFNGRLRDGVLATDLALVVTERLRQTDLAGRFVEYVGPGVASLSAGERAVIANMAPEYGASTGYFPIDANTLRYLRATGRSDEHCALVEDYARRQALWFDADATPTYSDVIDIDLEQVGMSLAGPRRPQDRVTPAEIAKGADRHVAIAAITSCTNTSDPRLAVAAGLLAQKARARSMTVPAWVKTSFAPGSPTASRYLQRAGLLQPLSELGFDIVGYGCTTCIGNAGPLVESTRTDTPVAILSGNRNFPGRVHAQIDQSYLASPPLVVAYALAGTVDLDITRDAIADGVYLADLWPTGAEIDAALAAVDPDDVAASYDEAEQSPAWAKLHAPDSALFPWDAASTYIRRPPFASLDAPSRLGHFTAYPLLVVGDDITTDHISPAGQIPLGGDAAAYLIARGANAADLNVFSSRRGNWEVMLRGLFTNKTVRNLLDPTLQGGDTIHLPSGDVLPLWQAAERYRAANDSVVLLAGARYGTGSSRDWAAKGPALLGVRAVLATSFERIHRTNLIGMGILPLQISAPLATRERITIDAPADRLQPRAKIDVTIGDTSLTATAAVETKLEVETLRAGGILPLILRRALQHA